MTNIVYCDTTDRYFIFQIYSLAMAGPGYQYQPDHCWALERVPWWEPPYLLHNGREEVRLGRREGNSKVCQGHQVSRNHALFVR